jgi:hypothetical protein
MAATNGEELSQPDPKKAFADAVARKREMLKADKKEKELKRAAEEKSKEKWSGLPIESRCIRQEKWDMSMKGKSLMPIAALGGPDPLGRDQVIIGVLCSTVLGPQSGPDGKELAQWTLSDLDLHSPQHVNLVLLGQALEYWSRKGGNGRTQAENGSIMAVLNPVLTGREKTVRISFATQLLKLGMCPSYRRCQAKTADGLACNKPFNKDSGHEYCALHADMSPWARQHQKSQSRVKKTTNMQMSASGSGSYGVGSRPVASPIGGPALAPPSGRALMILERAEANLRNLDGKTEIVRILKDLEAAEVDGVSLKHSKIYDRIGKLAQGQDIVGITAKSLRRKWRILMDDASRVSSVDQQCENLGQTIKRQRMG